MSGNINAREFTGARPMAGGNRYFYGFLLGQRPLVRGRTRFDVARKVGFAAPAAD